TNMSILPLDGIYQIYWHDIWMRLTWAYPHDLLKNLFYLLGVRPVWHPNGRVKGFEIIPLPELGRPRIDVTRCSSFLTYDSQK
ncbi:MAG: cobaltochelatase subunit CobN, partial [bacterium]|nr:cobaltochelatase subunit CobN [bacterium]